MEVVDSEKVSCHLHIDPVHYPDLIHWKLAKGMWVEKQHTMVTMGCYTAPVDPYVYCPTTDY